MMNYRSGLLQAILCCAFSVFALIVSLVALYTRSHRSEQVYQKGYEAGKNFTACAYQLPVCEKRKE